MASLGALRFDELLAQIASKTPAPGGGAVASATGALAAALAQMVVAFSIGKKALAAHQADHERAVRTLTNARVLLLRLADEDAQAYALVNELSRLPEADARRAAELPGATRASIQVPLATIAACADLLRLCESLAPITNPHLHSDLAIAAVLAEGAARASRWNVTVNVLGLAVGRERTAILEQADAAVEDAARRRAAVERACAHA